MKATGCNQIRSQQHPNDSIEAVRAKVGEDDFSAVARLTGRSSLGMRLRR
jgi:hypothetical protein